MDSGGLLSGGLRRQSAGAAALIESQNYDLILLCYSLRAEECRQVHKLVRARAPQSRILALTEGRDGCAEAYSDQQIPVADGPYALLKKVAEMIAPELSSQIRNKIKRTSEYTLPAVQAKIVPVSVAESIRVLRAKLN